MSGCGDVIPFMRLILCAVLTLAAICPAAVFAQKPTAEPRSNLVGSEPFTINSGRTFEASSPGTTAGSRSSGSVAARNRILDNLREAETIIGENYIDGKKITAAALTKSALTSMLHTLDPHSNFFDRNEWKELLDEQQSGYAGIGTTFAAFVRDGVTNTYILATFPATAARRAGLQFGDRITAVNGTLATGRSEDDIRDMIRGAAGTIVRLEVERASTGRIETVELRRGVVPQPSIPDFYIISPGIGYIDLSEGFNYTTNDEFSAALRELHKQGMTSLVLDLRGNGGGIVEQAVKVAERFLPAGSLILSQRGRTVADSREWLSSNNAPETMPLVVLVDENTASASEIVAGALQDSDRAIIVGEKTFGKGLVQDVIDLPYKSGLTLTAARYYTPTGRSIQRDYSEIGRYEYFNHRELAYDIDKPYYEARTITNRKMLGGDGIAPDEPIQAEHLTPIQSALIDPIFYFVRDIIGGRVDGFQVWPETAATGRKRIAATDFTVDDRLVEKFAAYVGESRFPGVTRSIIRTESDFIRVRIRYNFALSALGSVTAMQVLKDADRQVERAVEALPRAAKLTQLAAKLRR